ncbi:MAG: hypothetical protein ABI728_07100 [Betaproteobacteria bacterium]
MPKSFCHTVDEDLAFRIDIERERGWLASAQLPAHVFVKVRHHGKDADQHDRAYGRDHFAAAKRGGGVRRGDEPMQWTFFGCATPRFPAKVQFGGADPL